MVCLQTLIVSSEMMWDTWRQTLALCLRRWKEMMPEDKYEAQILAKLC